MHHDLMVCRQFYIMVKQGAVAPGCVIMRFAEVYASSSIRKTPRVALIPRISYPPSSSFSSKRPLKGVYFLDIFTTVFRVHFRLCIFFSFLLSVCTRLTWASFPLQSFAQGVLASFVVTLLHSKVRSLGSTTALWKSFPCFSYVNLVSFVT